MKSKTSLVIYTYSHFSVDFSCFFILFAGFSANILEIKTIAVGFLTYNIIAFGLQPFIGNFCDNKRNFPVGAIGCAIILAGLIAISNTWLSLIICALGNACFHIGGGIDSLVNANGKMYRSGIFVSSGAIGVSLGTLAGKSDISIIIPILLIVVALISVSLVSHKIRPYPAASKMAFNVASNKIPLLAILSLCFLSIMIRSYAGSIIPIDWKTTTFLMILPSIGACAGKALGGVFADFFGARRIGVLTLLASIPFLLLGNSLPILCVIGIIFFNMSMAITLCTIASVLSYNPGLSFGVTTLALLCGNVPTFLFNPQGQFVPIIIGVMAVISASCIFFSVSNERGGR